MESIYILASISAVLLGAWYLINPSFDPDEPPRVQPQIPLIGHIIGLLRYGFKYYRQTGRRTDAPIYILPMLNGGVCIARTKEVVNQISRNSKTLSFNPFIAPIAVRVTSAGTHCINILSKKATHADEVIYPHAVHKIQTSSLAPGEQMTALEKNMFGRVSKALQMEAASIGDSSQTIKLYHWARGILNGCVLRAIYGETAPFDKVAEFEDKWYTFEAGLDVMMATADIGPQYFARKAYDAREEMIKQLTSYYKNGIPENAAPLAKGRERIGLVTGLDHEEIARLEVAAMIGFIGNTAQSAFFLVAHICKQPGLLSEIRHELEEQLKINSPNYKPGDDIPYSFLTGIRSTCPLLRSVYDEILRLHHHGSSVRQALEDTWIRTKEDGEKAYLIKKGTVVLMPNADLHRNEVTFPDPDKFEPRRFMAAKPIEHRPWGGGETICPGRHFATSETLATISMLLLGFEFECVDEKGATIEWWIPEDYQKSLAAGVFQPSEDLNVKMKVRGQQSLRIDLES